VLKILGLLLKSVCRLSVWCLATYRFRLSVSSFILVRQTTTTYDKRQVTATETFLNETYVKNGLATAPIQTLPE